MSGPLLSERAQTAVCCRRPALSDFCRGFPALRAAAPDLAQRGPGEEERSGRLPPWAFSAMPLLINGERIDLTRLTGGVIRTHPHLEVSRWPSPRRGVCPLLPRGRLAEGRLRAGRPDSDVSAAAALGGPVEVAGLGRLCAAPARERGARWLKGSVSASWRR